MSLYKTGRAAMTAARLSKRRKPKKKMKAVSKYIDRKPKAIGKVGRLGKEALPKKKKIIRERINPKGPIDYPGEDTFPEGDPYKDSASIKYPKAKNKYKEGV